MIIAKDYDFYSLRGACWDCDDVFETVYNNDKEDDLMALLEDCFLESNPTLTEVNDLLRFDGEWVLESLGIEEEEEEDDDIGDGD